MSRYIPRTALVVLNTITLSIAIFSHPANAQHPIFVDLNQSRQFFNEGHEAIEHEIKWLQQDRKLPEIELPKKHSQPQAFDSSYSVDRQVTLKPISEAELDNKQ